MVIFVHREQRKELCLHCQGGTKNVAVNEVEKGENKNRSWHKHIVNLHYWAFPKADQLWAHVQIIWANLEGYQKDILQQTSIQVHLIPDAQNSVCFIQLWSLVLTRDELYPVVCHHFLFGVYGPRWVELWECDDWKRERYFHNSSRNRTPTGWSVRQSEHI